MKKGYRGYAFSREFGGQLVPQRVQNLVILKYAEKRMLNVIFSIFEFYMDHCHMMLNAFVEELDDISGLIFYSTHLLPESFEQRQMLYTKILDNGSEIHFALEELIIKNRQDIAKIEDIILCRQLSLQESDVSQVFECEDANEQRENRKC